MITLITLLVLSFSAGFQGRSSAPVQAVMERHEFHVSKCLIEYNEQEKALQISMHLFIDDLEEALRRTGADDLFICTQKEAENAELLLQQYLEEHFILAANEQEISFQFLGKEISDDLAAVWCYLEVRDIQALESLQVTNTLLLEVFDDQNNIVSVFGPKGKKGLLLFKKGTDTERIVF